ncbi:flagellar basal body-associated FliL family protein [Cellulomonas bogoriensis]|uniref:Flagellar protein FliL n=1 Tax=Cellulomonas bogoriensis 69B4 = DSM 16987 TaxID=1386082 RepID=A0A0A0BN43_9CELL|nr:flagellar basal body-associated FliL family protein [Cellulomonas bogoriensis]KGM09320.1 flagellar basal body rod protein [Cellulomonas bogoriensis 69B4 = DSM 16987]
MPTEQRVIASKPKIGSRPAPAAPTPEPEAAPAGGKKKRLAIVLVAILALGGGAGYWFMIGPGAGEAEAGTEKAEKPPEPGKVQLVESVSINLAGGHYLRLGLGLQLTKDNSYGTVDTARALDIAIALFSGQAVSDVNDPEGREELKAELLSRLQDAYRGEVIDVYFTDYVTQ